MTDLVTHLTRLLPIIAVLVVGGLVGLRMLQPYGDRILDLIEEMSKSRQAILEEERTLRQIHDRLDAVDDRLGTLAERQDFLESLLENRLEGGERTRELSRDGRAGGAPAGVAGDAAGDGEDAG